MAKQPKLSDWVYVAIENATGLEGFVGYRDEPSGVTYIPAFYEKETAQACFINMPREPGKKYEIQAVLFEELTRDAAANTFLIFMLDEEGRVMLKIDPADIAG